MSKNQFNPESIHLAGSQANAEPRNHAEKHDSNTQNRAEREPSSAEPESARTAELHLRLNQLLSGAVDEQHGRASFRQLLLSHVGAVGVAHLVRQNDESWDLNPSHATGRVPRRSDFLEKFEATCNQAIERNSVQVESFLGFQCYYAPVQVFGAADEILLLVTKDISSAKALFALETFVAYYGLWLKGKCSQQSDWKLLSLAALVELVSEIEQQNSMKSGCEVVVNELARHLNCSIAGICTKSLSGRLVLQAVSGASSFDKSSQVAKSIRTALSETLLTNELTAWPSGKNDESIRLAHRQLAQEAGVETVMSVPLKTNDERLVGALLLGGSKDNLAQQKLPNFLRAAAPRIASALDVVHRAQKSLLRRCLSVIGNFAFSLRGVIVGLAIVFFVLLMQYPVPYRVRSGCVVETTERRFVVAPFEGTIEQGLADTGDSVRRGDRLVQMDSQQLRYELTGVRAEMQRARKKRDIELADRKVSDSQLSELEFKKLTAREELLEMQLQQIDITSPIDGIVLRGERVELSGQAVELGKVIYEIGTLDDLRIEINILAEEISFVEQETPVRIWIDGLEDQSFFGSIDRIRPQSELRDARNVFVAEIKVENTNGRLRPGMEGRVRIDCAPQPLAWNLFHQPWQFLVTRLTWW
ncbi:MAG: efflux RND transporter periplasmic adaptor subunit [Planctomycetota bacterium]